MVSLAYPENLQFFFFSPPPIYLFIRTRRNRRKEILDPNKLLMEYSMAYKNGISRLQ